MIALLVMEDQEDGTIAIKTVYEPGFSSDSPAHRHCNLTNKVMACMGQRAVGIDADKTSLQELVDGAMDELEMRAQSVLDNEKPVIEIAKH